VQVQFNQSFICSTESASYNVITQKEYSISQFISHSQSRSNYTVKTGGHSTQVITYAVAYNTSKAYSINCQILHNSVGYKKAYLVYSQKLFDTSLHAARFYWQTEAVVEQ